MASSGVEKYSLLLVLISLALADEWVCRQELFKISFTVPPLFSFSSFSPKLRRRDSSCFWFFCGREQPWFLFSHLLPLTRVETNYYRHQMVQNQRKTSATNPLLLHIKSGGKERLSNLPSQKITPETRTLISSYLIIRLYSTFQLSIPQQRVDETVWLLHSMWHSCSKCSGKKPKRADRTFDHLFNQLGMMGVTAGKDGWSQTVENNAYLKHLDFTAQTALVAAKKF